jgi:hypothetical protein
MLTTLGSNGKWIITTSRSFSSLKKEEEYFSGRSLDSGSLLSILDVHEFEITEFKFADVRYSLKLRAKIQRQSAYFYLVNQKIKGVVARA